RTYPPTNPLCAEAIAAAQKALSRIGRERLVFRVHPRELIVDDTAIGDGTIVAFELSRRLHRAHVASLRIDAASSLRDLTRFCHELSGIGERPASGLTFAELLTERGVDRIVPTMALSPEVLEIGAPDQARRELVLLDRERRA